MKLSDIQNEFSRDLSYLIQYIQIEKGYECSVREVQRTMYQQRKYIEDGKSWTKNSRHLNSLAADIIIFNAQGQPIWDKKTLQDIGDFWESMHTSNRWGGNYSKKYQDVPHFERLK
jgi:hypothetical protein